MLYSLSERRDAPQAVRKLTGNGVPWVAVLASMVVGFLAVVEALTDLARLGPQGVVGQRLHLGLSSILTHTRAYENRSATKTRVSGFGNIMLA